MKTEEKVRVWSNYGTLWEENQVDPSKGHKYSEKLLVTGTDQAGSHSGSSPTVWVTPSPELQSIGDLQGDEAGLIAGDMDRAHSDPSKPEPAWLAHRALWLLNVCNLENKVSGGLWRNNL